MDECLKYMWRVEGQMNRWILRSLKLPCPETYPVTLAMALAQRPCLFYFCPQKASSLSYRDQVLLEKAIDTGLE